MKKNLFKLMVLVAMLSVLAVSAFADDYVDVVPTKHRIMIDGKLVPQEKVAGYLIKGNNYFRLRDLSELFDGTKAQFGVTYQDGSPWLTLGQNVLIKKENNGLGVISVGPGLPARNQKETVQPMPKTKQKAYKDNHRIVTLGARKFMQGDFDKWASGLRLEDVTKYNIRGQVYIKLRDVEQFTGAEFDFDPNTQTVFIDTKNADDFKNHPIEKIRHFEDIVPEAKNLKYHSAYYDLKAIRDHVQKLYDTNKNPIADKGTYFYDDILNIVFDDNGGLLGVRYNDDIKKYEIVKGGDYNVTLREWFISSNITVDSYMKEIEEGVALSKRVGFDIFQKTQRACVFEM